MQFINPTTDFAFKKIFGSPESADILLSFLNAVLGFKSPYRIKKVEIQDPYLPPAIKGMKDSFVDVRAIDEQGKHYIIEMQVMPVKNFEQRVLYNACKKYAGQIQKGEDYRLLNDVIALTVTDFVMFDHVDMVSKFKLRDESGREYSDDVELIFVELPKFKKNEHELLDLLDKWCYFLRNAQNLNHVPQVLAEESAIDHAFVIANRAQLSEKEQEMQERREMYIQDQRGIVEKALEDGENKGMKKGLEKGMQLGMQQGIEKGIEQGIEKGIEQGRQQGEAIGAHKKALEAAKNLRALGLADEQICAALGLSLQDLADL
jgi:predicted transposase/invertase (TIGR01784 family)